MPKVSHLCEYCNTEFFDYPNNKRRFCSPICNSKSAEDIYPWEQVEKLYSEGYGIPAIAQKLGIVSSTLYSQFKKEKAPFKLEDYPRPKRGVTKNKGLNEARVARLYQKGMSENELAQKFSVSRSVIARCLRNKNIERRSQNESEKLKWSKMDDDQRQAQVKAAHKATANPNEYKIIGTVVYMDLRSSEGDVIAITRFDLADLEKVLEYTWYCSNGYARTVTAGRSIAMHRVIMKPKKQEVVHHINQDKLDNCRSNLQIFANSSDHIKHHAFLRRQ